MYDSHGDLSLEGQDKQVSVLVKDLLNRLPDQIPVEGICLITCHTIGIMEKKMETTIV